MPHTDAESVPDGPDAESVPDARADRHTHADTEPVTDVVSLTMLRV